jgi:hypothetical protein
VAGAAFRVESRHGPGGLDGGAAPATKCDEGRADPRFSTQEAEGFENPKLAPRPGSLLTSAPLS